jgi:predicted RNase H-like HicB family nuclease
MEEAVENIKDAIASYVLVEKKYGRGSLISASP